MDARCARGVVVAINVSNRAHHLGPINLPAWLAIPDRPRCRADNLATINCDVAVIAGVVRNSDACVIENIGLIEHKSVRPGLLRFNVYAGPGVGLHEPVLAVVRGVNLIDRQCVSTDVAEALAPIPARLMQFQ